MVLATAAGTMVYGIVLHRGMAFRRYRDDAVTAVFTGARMVAWVRHRRHIWPQTAEMAADVGAEVGTRWRDGRTPLTPAPATDCLV